MHRTTNEDRHVGGPPGEAAGSNRRRSWRSGAETFRRIATPNSIDLCFSPIQSRTRAYTPSVKRHGTAVTRARSTTTDSSHG